jgi:hypothetical protein
VQSEAVVEYLIAECDTVFLQSEPADIRYQASLRSALSVCVCVCVWTVSVSLFLCACASKSPAQIQDGALVVTQAKKDALFYEILNEYYTRKGAF